MSWNQSSSTVLCNFNELRYTTVFKMHRNMMLMFNVFGSNPAQMRYTRYNIFYWLATSRWFPPGTSVLCAIKTNCHDIIDLLYKVALNTINPNPNVLYQNIFSPTFCDFWIKCKLQILHIKCRLDVEVYNNSYLHFFHHVYPLWCNRTPHWLLDLKKMVSPSYHKTK